MGKVIVITGGVRSGKSAWALQKANSTSKKNKVFLATAEIVDDEMRQRAINHQKQRGDSWSTIEEPVALAQRIAELSEHCCAVLDCCTVWLGNVWHRCGDDASTLQSHIDELCVALTTWKENKSGTLIIVTNEVGWGIVPHEPAVRRYRDFAGLLNQRLAAIAQEVYLSVAAIAVPIKTTEE